MSERWKVRKWRSKHHPVTLISVWEVFDQDGAFSGAFDNWPEAMQWATSVSTRLEYWLEHQL